MKSRLDFTKDELRVVVLKYAAFTGNKTLTLYLNELLEDVKQFNDEDFRFHFFMDIQSLFTEYSDKFWCAEHRNNIADWLKNNSRFMGCQKKDRTN